MIKYRGKYDDKNLFLALVMLCAPLNILVAQDELPLSVASGKLFQTEDNKSLTEVWDNSGLIGNPLTNKVYDIFTLSSGELLLRTSTNHLFVMSKTGEILAIMYNITRHVAVMGDKIFTLEAENFDKYSSDDCNARILVFNNNLKLEKTVSIPGIPKSCVLDRLRIAANGDFIVLAYDHHPSSKHNEVIYLFNNEGNPKNAIKDTDDTFQVGNILPDLSGNILAFANNSIVKFNSSGERIGSSKLPYDSNGASLVYVTSTPRNTALLSYADWPNDYVVEMSLSGTPIKKLSVKTPDGKGLKDVICIASCQEGKYYISHGDISKNELQVFSAAGYYQASLYPLTEEQLPGEVSKARRMSSFIDICEGNGGNLFALPEGSGRIFVKMDYNGKIRKTYNLPAEGYLNPKDILSDSTGRILILCQTQLLIYDPAGDLLKTVKFDFSGSEGSAYEFAIDNNDNIYIYRLPSRAETNCIHVFNSDGIKIKELIPEQNANYGYDFAMDRDGYFYFINGNSALIKFSPAGQQVADLALPQFSSFVDVGPDGNIYISGTGVDVFSPDFEQIARMGTELKINSPRRVLKARNGKTYIPSKDTTTVINNYFPYSGDLPGATITGKHQAKGGLYIRHWMEPRAAYLEGIDNKGNRIFAISKLNDKDSYSFNNVPLGSRLNVWVDNFKADQVRYKRPVSTFKVSKASYRKSFKYSLIPPDKIIIKGRVFFKKGVPLAGALVKCGSDKAVSDITGFFSISATPDSLCEVTVFKNGVKFFQNEKEIQTGNHDYMYLDFLAKPYRPKTN